MSFILDALRKSESDRRRDAAPSLHQLPLAPPRPGVPVWVWSTIAFLSLCVAVLGGAWWQGTREGAAPAAALTRETAPAAATGLVPEPVPAPEAEPEPERLAPRTTVDAGAAPALLAEENARTLPSLEQVVAEGLALPPLELQLLSYSEDSTERFVFINGFQYRQGQRVQNGPLIVSIYRDGVVLRHDGRDFALLPE